MQLAADKSGLDREQLTVIAYDLPGYGRSALPAEWAQRSLDPTRDYYEMAARIGAKLMSQLGHKRFAVGGWSDGARVACLLAIECQSRVDALLLWGFSPLIDKHSCEAIARTRDTSAWDKRVLEPYTSVYGEQRFGDMWRRHVDYLLASLELSEKMDISEDLRKIKCPTLVLHGAKDPIINFEQHVAPLDMKIYDSEIMQLKHASHNLHQAHAGEFNALFTRFVTGVTVI